jgi:hypothetical protein
VYFWLKVLLAGALLISLFLVQSGFIARGADLAPQSTPTIGGCPVFPADNVWNTPVDTLPVDHLSAQTIHAIGPNIHLHPDFGSAYWDGGPIGIPFNVVDASTPKFSFDFWWPGESDSGPYPIPTNPLIEYGSDQHLLVVDSSTCKLYELYAVTPPSGGQGWQAGSGAIYDLNSNALRPSTWTSADAAGLPMVPGLARYAEVAAGHIDHALRFTVASTQAGYIWPARHDAPTGTQGTYTPVMGMRFRLKSTFDINGYGPQAQVILKALQKYGMIVADNGSSWYISGEPNAGWDEDDIGGLKNIAGSNFELVDESSLQVSADSGQARVPNLTVRAWLPIILR